MLFNDYLTDIQKTIGKVHETGVLLSSDITADLRTEHLGLLKGELAFLDGSILFFKEYLDLRYRIDKIMYSFHYQDIHAVLRFRYDNADHKPALGFRSHKHTPAGTHQTVVPELREVLEEILTVYLSGS